MKNLKYNTISDAQNFFRRYLSSHFVFHLLLPFLHKSFLHIFLAFFFPYSNSFTTRSMFMQILPFSHTRPNLQEKALGTL